MILDTVVVKPQPLSKARLHAKLMRGVSRGIDKAGGKGRFADAIDLSVQALDKQLSGSMPGVEVLDRMMDAEPSVLDDWMRAKGKRIVDEDAVCDSDDLNVLLARVSLMLAEAEHPDSPGGRTIVPQEYLTGEEAIRKLHAMTGRWLARCADIRRPRAVA
jgi:hypothetical protein